MYVTCNQRAIGWVIRDKTAVSNLSKVILWMMAPRFEHTILWICAEHLNHSAIAASSKNNVIITQTSYAVNTILK